MSLLYSSEPLQNPMCHLKTLALWHQSTLSCLSEETQYQNTKANASQPLTIQCQFMMGSYMWEKTILGLNFDVPININREAKRNAPIKEYVKHTVQLSPTDNIVLSSKKVWQIEQL